MIKRWTIIIVAFACSPMSFAQSTTSILEQTSPKTAVQQVEHVQGAYYYVKSHLSNISSDYGNTDEIYLVKRDDDFNVVKEVELRAKFPGLVSTTDCAFQDMTVENGVIHVLLNSFIKNQCYGYSFHIELDLNLNVIDSAVYGGLDSLMSLTKLYFLNGDLYAMGEGRDCDDFLNEEVRVKLGSGDLQSNYDWFNIDRRTLYGDLSDCHQFGMDSTLLVFMAYSRSSWYLLDGSFQKVDSGAFLGNFNYTFNYWNFGRLIHIGPREFMATGFGGIDVSVVGQPVTLARRQVVQELNPRDPHNIEDPDTFKLATPIVNGAFLFDIPLDAVDDSNLDSVLIVQVGHRLEGINAVNRYLDTGRVMLYNYNANSGTINYIREIETGFVAGSDVAVSRADSNRVLLGVNEYQRSGANEMNIHWLFLNSDGSLSSEEDVVLVDHLYVSPNPFSAQLRVHGLERVNGAVDYQVTDMRGVAVKAGILGQEREISFRNENIPSGPYVLTLFQDERIIGSIKIVKE